MNTEEKINQILENQKQLMKELGFIEELLKAMLVNNILNSVENTVDIKQQMKDFFLENGKAKCDLIGKYAYVKEGTNICYKDSYGMPQKTYGYFRQHFCLNSNEIRDYNPINNRVKLHYTSKKYDYSIWIDLSNITII